MRWSSRRGTLCLYPSAPVLTIEVATSDPGAATRPVTVTLSVSGRLLDRFDLRRGGLTRSVFMPEALWYRPPPRAIPFGECLPDRASVPLTVEVSRLWSPYVKGSSDGRLLGVAVFAPSFRTLRPGEDLGLYPAEFVEGRSARWMGARASVFVALPAERSRVVVPVRAPKPRLGTRPVRVEAFWNEQNVVALSLSDDRWHDLRLEAGGSSRQGILTLEVDQTWPPNTLGIAGDWGHVGLQVGAIRAEPIGPAADTPSGGAPAER